MRWLPKEKGCHETDRTLEEYVDGFEIAFFYEGKTYRTGGTPDEHLVVFEADTNKVVIETDSENVNDFLNMDFIGKPLREVIEKKAYFLGIC